MWWDWEPVRWAVPVECVFTLGAEEVDVVLELELEHILLVYVIPLVGRRHRVAQQRQTGQREIVLKAEEMIRRCCQLRRMSAESGDLLETFCRRKGRNWWRRPTASASRCCFWICAGGSRSAGSVGSKQDWSGQSSPWIVTCGSTAGTPIHSGRMRPGGNGRLSGRSYLESQKVISGADRRVSVPADVNCRVAPLLLGSLPPAGADVHLISEAVLIQDFFRRA